MKIPIIGEPKNHKERVELQARKLGERCVQDFVTAVNSAVAQSPPNEDKNQVLNLFMEAYVGTIPALVFIFTRQASREVEEMVHQSIAQNFNAVRNRYEGDNDGKPTNPGSATGEQAQADVLRGGGEPQRSTDDPVGSKPN